MRLEIFTVFLKELKVIVGERMLLTIITAQPIILVFVFGYAFSGEIKNVEVAVVDKGADFGVREIEVTAKYTILASKIEKKELVKSLRVVVEEIPEIVVLNKPVMHHGGKRCEA